MRIAIGIHTPAQANFWYYPILMLREEGNDVLTLARDDKLTCEILQEHGIQYSTYGKAGKTNFLKIARLPWHILRSIAMVRKFKPDIISGSGLIEAYSALSVGKPCIIFEDTEITPFIERFQWLRLASTIITPDCFRLNFGKKHIHIKGYKEIAYLHPNYFEPDPNIFDELNIKKSEKYIILRFAGFGAIHDIGLHGLAFTIKYKLIEELKKFGKVFISAEGSLPPDLEGYQLPVSPLRIHHALYYAYMLVSDTGTMTTEAAVLGTPVVRLSPFLWRDELGNFIDLEKSYDLIYNYSESEQVLQKAVELIQKPDLKEEWMKKRQKMLSDKIDVSRFMVNFIENYPESINKMKNNRMQL